MQVPGKPLLITQEPPPEEDVGQLRDLQNSFKGGAFLGQQHLPLFTHLLFETMSAESASMKLWHLLFSSCELPAAEVELEHTGLLDKKGNLVPDSHFIFTALPNSDFMAESKSHSCRSGACRIVHVAIAVTHHACLVPACSDGARSGAMNVLSAP